jgi:N6-adenosine-specific RNA methylase IME4
MSKEKIYDLIYADPPWRYANMEVQGSPENHYSTMSIDDICNLKINSSSNSVLALWATSPLLPEALQVIKAWGFTYKTSLVWDKEKLGLGYWFRIQHEFLLIATKGKPKPPSPENRIRSVLRCKSGKHSQKPYEFYKVLNNLSPGPNRLEMFARYEDKLFKPDGWDFWGNESGT